MSLNNGSFVSVKFFSITKDSSETLITGFILASASLNIVFLSSLQYSLGEKSECDAEVITAGSR